MTDENGWADYPAWARRVASLPWIVGAAVAATTGAILTGALIYAAPGVSPQFYATAAQVLPVFALAVALEGRLFQIGKFGPPVLNGYYAIIWGWIVAGEAAALLAVASGGSSALLGIAVTGLALAGTALASLAVLGPP